MVEYILTLAHSIFGFVQFVIQWFTDEHSNSAWVYVLLIQLVISALLAFLGWRFLPLKFREPHWPILGLLFCLSFFIPFAGVIGFLLGVLQGLYWHRKKRAHPFLPLLLPEFDLVLREPEIKFGSGGIKACLDNSAMPPRRRLQALLTMQSVAARTSNPVLQNLLNDSGEDIRLVAYGLLDGREKKINYQTHDELNRLNFMPNSAIKIISLRHLAELEWELVYTGLAQGDLRKRALSQSLGYLDQALAIDATLSGLWFLKGRVQLERQLYGEAQFAFEQAQKLGLMPTRLYPYFAELAFVQGHFQQVNDLLLLMKSGQIPARMEPLMHYWLPSRLGLTSSWVSI